jgi:hypothetical protein
MAEHRRRFDKVLDPALPEHLVTDDALAARHEVAQA